MKALTKITMTEEEYKTICEFYNFFDKTELTCDEIWDVLSALKEEDAILLGEYNYCLEITD